MPKVFLSMILLTLLLTGCARPPEAKLAEAKRQLALARGSGAQVYAQQEYRQAEAVLAHAEEMYADGRYKRVAEILPIAFAKARAATQKALQVREARELEDRKRVQKPVLRQSEKVPPPVPEKPKPLQAPAESLEKETAEKAQPLSHYLVETGETLWTIAAQTRVYGDALLWPLLYRANRDQIKDPRQIYLGQSLTIPRNLSAEELASVRESAQSSGVFPVAENEHFPGK